MWIVIYRFKNKSKIEMFTLQFNFFLQNLNLPIRLSIWHEKPKEKK